MQRQKQEFWKRATSNSESEKTVLKDTVKQNRPLLQTPGTHYSKHRKNETLKQKKENIPHGPKDTKQIPNTESQSILYVKYVSYSLTQYPFSHILCTTTYFLSWPTDD